MTADEQSVNGSTQDRSPAVQGMFDRIAGTYDRVNRIMTFGLDRRWRQALVRRIGVAQDDTVLDLGCGTGDFLDVLRPLTAKAIGADFSAGMLARARERGLGDALVLADARRLPLPDASVDAVVSGFTLRNFTPLEQVIAEAGRVVRPGGRIGLLEVDLPRNRLAAAGHSLYFRRVVPVVGGLLSRDRPAYRYLPDSTAYLPGDKELAAMLQRAGFAGIRKRRFSFGAVQMVTATRQ